MANSMVVRRTAIRTVVFVGIIVLLVGLLVFWHAFIRGKIGQAMAAMATAPATVSTTTAKLDTWQDQMAAVGSTRAVHGVDVTTEIAGLVRSLNFKSGDEVKSGALLVQLNADSDIATLHALQASVELAQTVLKRDKDQLSVDAISQAQVDNDTADLKNKQAQAASQQAIIDKKTIRAPFAGKLGISTVNPGQFLNPGDKIVTLQSVDPIYIDFNLPQQKLSSLSVGQPVSVTTDSYPNQMFAGKLTAIDPKIDPGTRNVSLEATIPNSKRSLFPGMFGRVLVDNGSVQHYITLPQTAITFNAYGSTVFVAKQTPKKDNSSGTQLTAQQVFVETGPTRGDQIAVIKGLAEGDVVVTSGQLKLYNGTPLVVDNSIVPTDAANPKPQEH